MGGDNFPESNLDGVFDYLEQSDDSNVHFYLIGNKSIFDAKIKSLIDKPFIA